MILPEILCVLLINFCEAAKQHTRSNNVLCAILVSIFTVVLYRGSNATFKQLRNNWVAMFCISNISFLFLHQVVAWVINWIHNMLMRIWMFHSCFVAKKNYQLYVHDRCEIYSHILDLLFSILFQTRPRNMFDAGCKFCIAEATWFFQRVNILFDFSTPSASKTCFNIRDLNLMKSVSKYHRWMKIECWRTRTFSWWTLTFQRPDL